jgi:hypothetical protein
VPGAKIALNMYLSPWVPQSDILGKFDIQISVKMGMSVGHPSLKAFVTHGGYNSLLESAYAGECFFLSAFSATFFDFLTLSMAAVENFSVAGKPIVTIPLFGDQNRNGRSAERNRFGVVLEKTAMSEHNLDAALRRILENDL